MIKNIPVGMMPTNCYIVYDNFEAMVVDPGDKSEEIVNFIEENQLKVKYIYLTHCHFDHVLGVKWLKEKVGGQVCCLDKEENNINNKDVVLLGQNVFENIYYNNSFKIDKIFFENDEIQVGNINFKVIHTPGHTSGSSCLYGDGILISGDTLFKDSYGRCDLPTGNIQDMMKSLDEKVLTLPENTIVYPGHGQITKISVEKANNII